MLVYRYGKDTHEFLYSEPTVLDPLETELQNKNIWMLPANATFVAPPTPNSGYTVCWNGTEWEQVEDHRPQRGFGGEVLANTGTPYWMPDDAWDSSPRFMKTPGALPKDALLTPPEKPKLQKTKERIQELEEYLFETDWYAVRFVETGVAIPDEVRDKRNSARIEISKLREESYE